MLLIGQYDSSFVRRVGIALTLYGIPFEHSTWSTFGDADKIRAYNPLSRVPTLVLDDSDVIIESHAMLDYIDSLVPAERRMFPVREPERHRAIKVAALGTSLADKGVSLFYEQRLHRETSDLWIERCRTQIGTVLEVLEADRAARPTQYWFGEEIGHADIAVACALRHVGDSLPDLLPPGRYPALAAHAEKLEALPVFQAISQAFIAPT